MYEKQHSCLVFALWQDAKGNFHTVSNFGSIFLMNHQNGLPPVKHAKDYFSRTAPEFLFIILGDASSKTVVLLLGLTCMHKTHTGFIMSPA